MVYISQCVSQKQLKRNFYNNYGKYGAIWLIFVKGFISSDLFRPIGNYRFESK